MIKVKDQKEIRVCWCNITCKGRYFCREKQDHHIVIEMPLQQMDRLWPIYQGVLQAKQASSGGSQIM